jgi:hypothetical protein
MLCGCGSGSWILFAFLPDFMIFSTISNHFLQDWNRGGDDFLSDAGNHLGIIRNTRGSFAVDRRRKALDMRQNAFSCDLNPFAGEFRN